MTISSTTRTAGPFTGNGTASLFPFAFKVFQASDLLVANVLIATGVASTLALTTDYTVALNANQDSNPGGSVTLTAGALAVGYRLIISSNIGTLQPTVYLNQGGFYPEVLTASLDRATILIQQLQAYVDLALQFPLTDPTMNNVLPSAEERAGKVLMFDANGNPTLITIASGTSLLAGQEASGLVDGTNRSFRFTALTTVAPAALVFKGGIFQTPGTDYPTPTLGIPGSWNIVFTDAPVEGPITVVLL
jgi:hypothetical protein